MDILKSATPKNHKSDLVGNIKEPKVRLRDKLLQEKLNNLGRNIKINN